MRLVVLVVVLLAASCTSATTAPDAATASVVAVCGAIPDAPAYAAEFTTDANGAPIAIVPAAQFNARIAWEDAMSAWATCAIGVAP